jgi:hypothetical protein
MFAGVGAPGMPEQSEHQADREKLKTMGELLRTLGSSFQVLKFTILSVYGKGHQRHEQADAVNQVLQRLVLDLLVDQMGGRAPAQPEPPHSPELEAIVDLSKALGNGSKKLREAIREIYGDSHQRYMQASQSDELLQQLVAEIMADCGGEHGPAKAAQPERAGKHKHRDGSH